MRISDWSSDVCSSDLPDLRGDAALIGERIVGGNAAVGIEADDLAEIGFHVLRGREFLALARSDEEIFSVGREEKAVRIMAPARHLGILFPEIGRAHV